MSTPEQSRSRADPDVTVHVAFLGEASRTRWTSERLLTSVMGANVRVEVMTFCKGAVTGKTLPLANIEMSTTNMTLKVGGP